MNPRQLRQNCSVPHPFAFFLANGWETTKLNQILVHGE